MADLFTSLISIAQVGDAGDKPVPGTTPQVKKTFSAGRRLQSARIIPPLGHALTGNTRFLWKLDEVGNTDTVIDSTGNYPLPTAVGSLLAEAGQIGNGRHFSNSGDGTMSGASDAGTVSKFAWAAGDWTMGFWIKIPAVDTGPTTRGILTLCDGGDLSTAVFYLKTAFAGIYLGASASGNIFTNIDLTGQSGLWVHCVLAFDSTGLTYKAWRNGIAQTNFSPGTPNPSTLAVPTWVLGKAQSVGFAGQNMVLDDVWFENTLWTTPQVLADYNQGFSS